jgi:hypothetical protein
LGIERQSKLNIGSLALFSSCLLKQLLYDLPGFSSGGVCCAPVVFCIGRKEKTQGEDLGEH